MMFNATFNNISVISRQSVLLVEETGENPDFSQVTDKLKLSHNERHTSIRIYYVNNSWV